MNTSPASLYWLWQAAATYLTHAEQMHVDQVNKVQPV